MVKNFTFAVLTASLLMLPITSASAADQVFVSPQGKDTDPGTELLPKRTIAAAIDAVDTGGDVVVTESGDYGSVRIGKSLSLIAPEGVFAGIRGNTGILVDAAAGSVVLRGLSVRGEGSSSIGISVAQADAVHIENCVIHDCNEGVVSNARTRLFVKSSELRANGFAAMRLPGGRTAIDHVRVEAGGHGVISQFAEATITDTLFAGNRGTGVLVQDGSVVTIRDSEITDSGADGVSVTGSQTPSVVRLSGTAVTDNFGTGIFAAPGGTVETRGNNTVRGNGTDSVGPVVADPGF